MHVVRVYFQITCKYIPHMEYLNELKPRGIASLPPIMDFFIHVLRFLKAILRYLVKCHCCGQPTCYIFFYHKFYHSPNSAI